MRRRTFVEATAAASLAVALPAAAQTPAAPRSLGPLLGHVAPDKALVWFRGTAAGQVELKVTEQGSRDVRVLRAEAALEHDLCLTWTIADLQPGREYVAEVVAGPATGDTVGKPCLIRTPALPETPAKVRLVFGSCASSVKFFDVWDQMAEVGADGVVLLGDTPYIDKTDLASNRQAHREFLSIPNLGELVRTRPLWATWDDHDFGGNDSDGNIKNKKLIRQAFCEYRALETFGADGHGIYARFRYGPVEVFLLDPRYFSQTERSPVAADQPTCLGKTQWKWLLDGLANSTAPFKILATGMIWDDKKNKEKDDWETYAHEREALYDFIAAKAISGVILIGGDIHVSRHLKYPLQARLGYDLHQCIVSPLHERTIPSLNIPHPCLLWGELIPNVFLQVVADTTVSPATFTANWIDRLGKVQYSLALTADDVAVRK